MSLAKAIGTAAVSTLPIDIPIHSFDSLSMVDAISDVAKRMAFSQESTILETSGNIAARRLFTLAKQIRRRFGAGYTEPAKVVRTLPALVDDIPEGIDLFMESNIGVVAPKLYRWAGSMPQKYVVSMVGPQTTFDAFEGEVLYVEELENKPVDISTFKGKCRSLSLGPYCIEGADGWYYRHPIDEGYVLRPVSDEFDWSKEMIDIDLKPGPQNSDKDAFSGEEITDTFNEAQKQGLQPFLYNMRASSSWLDGKHNISGGALINIFRRGPDDIIKVKLSGGDRKLYDEIPLSILYQRLLPGSALQMALEQHEEYLENTNDCSAVQQGARRRYVALARAVEMNQSLNNLF